MTHPDDPSTVADAAAPPTDTPPPAPLEPARRFCRACGRGLDPAGACPACAASPPPALDAHPSTPPPDPRPLRPAFALYFVWLAISAASFIALIADAPPFPVDVLSTSLITAIVLVWTLFARRELAAPLTRPAHPAWYAAALAGAFLTFACASLAVKLLGLFDLPDVNYTDPIFEAGYGWGAAVLLICLQPAVIEELSFRGIIYAALARVLTPTETIVVSALLFMILHLSVPSFPHLFLIGLALGYLRHRTGSLYPGMALHFTHNLLCVLSERWGHWTP